MFEVPAFDARLDAHALPEHGPALTPALTPAPLAADLPAVTPRPYAGFELPVRVWGGMLASYVLFFVAIIGATGGSGHALFAIVVSILYTVMFFGLARVMARQAGPEAVSPLDRGRPLQTWTGPMQASAVYGQVLVVPMAIASFGVAIAVIVAVVL